MQKIRILAVEDNPIHQENILISLESMGYDMVGMADSAKEALHLLVAVQPDVILIDIELVGDEDGVELAKKINRLRPTPIIFTTGLSDPATISRATATEPYSYLVKPIEPQNLQPAIELAVYRFAKEKERGEAENVLPVWNQDVFFRDSLFTKQGSKLVKIPFSEITIIEVAKDRYCSIHTSDESFLVRTSLREIAGKLPPNAFIQVHRSYIVRAAAISSIDDAEGMLQLKQRTVPLGKSFSEQILRMLNTI